MNALANLLKAGTPVESDTVDPLQKTILESEAARQKLREENPELNMVFDAIESAVDEAADKYNLKLAEQDLYNQLNEVMAGRLESDIPLSDDYWSIKQSITRQLHVLEHGE